MRAAGDSRDLDISGCVQGDHYEAVCRWLVQVFDTLGIDDDALFGVIDVSHRYIHVVMKPRRGGELQAIVMGALSLVLKERYGKESLPFSPKEIVQHLCHNQVAPKLIQAIEYELLQRVGRLRRPNALSFVTAFCMPLFSLDPAEWNDGLEVGPAQFLIHGHGTRRPAIFHLASRVLHVLLFVAQPSVCVDKPAVVIGSASLFTALWLMRAPTNIVRSVGSLVSEVAPNELKRSILLASNVAIGLARRDEPSALEEKFASPTRCNVLKWERHESELRDLWDALNLQMPRESEFQPVPFGPETQ
jgi:hypothetical protein